MTIAANTQSYATLEDLDESGLPPGALGSVPFSVRQKALLRASRIADSYLRDRYSLPLAPAFDQALIDAVVRIATYSLMVRRGFDLNVPGDAVIRMGYDDAISWLRSIANGQVTIDVNQATPESMQPELGTTEARGFGGTTNAEQYVWVGPNSVGL